MARIGLYAGMIWLLCAAVFAVGAAQTETAIKAKGSAIAGALLHDLAEASGIAGLEMKPRGSKSGIKALCNGETDLAPATRKMNAEERAACEAKEIVYSELLIAHHITAFIAHPDAPTQCLQMDAIESALKPSASNLANDWSFYSEDNADLPLVVLLPADSALPYVIADGMIAGDGLRLDGALYEAPTGAIAAVAETEGALAIVPWSEQLGEDAMVRVLQVGQLSACRLPSAEAVESGDYGFALSLYVYVNRASLEASDSLNTLMQFSISESSAAVITAAGAVPPSATMRELNGRLLTDAAADASITGRHDDFRIPPDLSGEIIIAGAANAHQILKRAAENLGAQLSTEFRYAGTAAGGESLCQGDADIVALDATALLNALEICESIGIASMPIQLGAQATVLLANAADDFATCLTTDQVNAIWQARSAGAVMAWSDADDSLPEMSLTLFGMNALDTHTDMLLQTADAPIPPVRRDSENHYDPLYRAAAVANVSGALTYMSWQDYLSVLENEQANIQLVAVDSGDGCVEANPASIGDGSYPLSRDAALLLSEASLAQVEVQSLLWTLLAEETWTSLEDAGFLSASALELPIMRRDLLARFAEAESIHTLAEAESADSQTEDEAESSD